MVLSKITQALNRNDEKYEMLLHKYSSLKLKNKQLLEKKNTVERDTQHILGEKFAIELMEIYEAFEKSKEQSFKVHATSPELQRFLLEYNTIGKVLDKSMKHNGVEVFDAKERFFDPDLHEVATYQEGKGMQKGIILKTTRKGCKFRNKVVKKPRVVVTS